MRSVRVVERAAIPVLALVFTAACGCSGGGTSNLGGPGDDASLGSDASTPDATSASVDARSDASEGMDSEAGGDADATAETMDAGATADADAGATADADAGATADADAGAVTGGPDAGTDAGAGLDASTCFVPYGCAAYVCGVVSDTAADAGDAGDAGDTADGGTELSGAAVPTAGPRAGLTGDGGVDAGGLGAGEAYSFALTDTLLGSDPKLPQGASPRTMALWVQPVANGGTSETLFNYGSFATNERFGLLDHVGTDYFVGENEDVNGNKVLTDGAWHHVAATYDGTTLSLYVDGTLDTSSTLSGDILNTVGTAFAIGTTVGVTSREPFQGNVSDVRVYDRVLTSIEIGSLATFSGATANPEALRSSTSGLVFWLPLFNGTEVMRNRCAP